MATSKLRFRDATIDDVALIAALQNAAAGALTARYGAGAYDAAAGAANFYLKCGFKERRRVVYRADPLIYYELLLE